MLSFSTTWLRLHQFSPPALFFLNYLGFCHPHLLALSDASSPPLSISPASKSICPSIMIVDLGFAKLFHTSPSFFKPMPPFLADSTCFYLQLITFFLLFCTLAFFLRLMPPSLTNSTRFIVVSPSTLPIQELTMLYQIDGNLHCNSSTCREAAGELLETRLSRPHRRLHSASILLLWLWKKSQICQKCSVESKSRSELSVDYWNSHVS